MQIRGASSATPVGIRGYHDVGLASHERIDTMPGYPRLQPPPNTHPPRLVRRVGFVDESNCVVAVRYRNGVGNRLRHATN
jgi:hypothetical protein